MKKYLIVMVAAITVFAAPVSVFPFGTGSLWDLSFVADCDYFSMTFSGATWDCAGDVAYELILTPQNSANDPIIINGTFDVPGILGPYYNQFCHETFTGAWGTLPCGEYIITGTISLMCRDTAVYTLDIPASVLVCGCTYDFDPKTPGYWKNHPEMWPVATLALGGVEYTQAQLLVMLDTPVRGDAKVIMIKHLIAAKLNLLSGADPGIQESIDAADACLINNCDKKNMLSIKDALDAYNNLNLE